MKRPPKIDAVTVMAHVHRFDLPTERWLDALVRAVAPGLDGGFGVLAVHYDASDMKTLRSLHMTGTGWVADHLDLLASMGPVVGLEMMEAIMWTGGCSAVSRILGPERFRTTGIFHEVGFSRGQHDFVQVNATDPSGIGVLLGAPQPTPSALSPKTARGRVSARSRRASARRSGPATRARTSRPARAGGRCARS